MGGGMRSKPVATGETPREGADARSNKLMLEAWRREVDAWSKRVERADDIAGALLTTCLTAGVVGAAAAGYVQENAPERLGLVMWGIAVLIVVGTLVLGLRAWLCMSPPGALSTKLPPDSASSDENAQVAELVRRERERVEVMRRRHRFLGRLLFASLLAFAVAVSLIVWAAYAALEAA